MKGWLSGVMTLLMVALSPAPRAEYLIYLKGGHYIVADDCAFSTGQAVEQDAEVEKELVVPKECTKGKPGGRIFWSTTDGRFGEVNADDVYAIFGAKTLTPKRPSPLDMPLQDYLITNRGESFVNAKTIEQREDRIYGVKRDELATISRRGVTEIAPEGKAKARSGEGLCPGEPADFSVTEAELVDGHLGGVVTNLSPAAWKPLIEVEVREKGRFKGKFSVTDLNILPPGNSIPIYELVPHRFLEYFQRIADPETGVRLCYRKVKTGASPPAK